MPPHSILIIPASVAVAFMAVLAQAVTDSRTLSSPLSFSDCAGCPTMVVVRAGTFKQGDLQGSGDADEQQVRQVMLGRAFALGRTEVTYTQWDVCVQASVCRVLEETHARPRQRALLPVQNVSWDDAKTYIDWLSARTGHVYRLPTESEFEYAARAGTLSRYPWGDSPSRRHSNYGSDECCGGDATADDRWVETAPVGSFPPNGFGLFDMAGNVQEWMEDCWFENYEAAPADGSARTEGGDCAQRVLRGGSWSSTPKMIRPANRDKGSAGAALPYYGFRVARDL